MWGDTPFYNRTKKMSYILTMDPPEFGQAPSRKELQPQLGARALMRQYLTAVILMSLFGTTTGLSQHWSLGGNIGMSSFDGSAGFHFTPVAEMLFNSSMGVGTEFSINTQYGMPILWYPYFKYYFRLHDSKVRPYANVGPVMMVNILNAPYFGILFGGGANIPIAHKLFLAPDATFGPVFGVGKRTYALTLYGNYYGDGYYSASSYSVPGRTIFSFSVRAGIRYVL